MNAINTQFLLLLNTFIRSKEYAEVCVYLSQGTSCIFYLFVCVLLYISGDWGGNSHSTTLELAPGTWHIIWLANPCANEGILGEGVSARWSCLSQVHQIQQGECVRVLFREAETEMLFFYTFSHVCRRFRPTPSTGNPEKKDLGREDLMRWERNALPRPFPHHM